MPDIILVSGGFDPIHSGHIEYFYEAKKLGDQLIVALNSDAWLVNKKGKFFMPFDEREIVVSNLAMVDKVISFDDDNQGSCCSALESVKLKYPQDEIKFDISQIKLVTIDIETASERGFPDVESASEEILAITIQDYNTKKITTWGIKPFFNKQENVTYYHCPTEQVLLSHFINYWMVDVPDVITGWNIQFYDIPYICKRLNRVLGEKLMKRFSPWGLVTENEVTIKGRTQTTFDVGGVTQLDYLDLYKKFTYKAQESYRLDYIAEVELGQKKLDHSEFDTFKDFYTHGWQKFIEYNLSLIHI